MSFATWITGVAAAVWRVFKPLLMSELARIAADPEVQALATKAVKIAATYVKENDGDQKFEIAVRGLRQDAKNIGKDLCLGWASTIIQQAFYRLRQNDPKALTPDVK